MSKFIVVFKDDVSKEEVEAQAKAIEAAGGTVTNRYDSDVLNGFAAIIPESHLQTLQSPSFQSKIDYIEPDGVVTTQ